MCVCMGVWVYICRYVDVLQAYASCVDVMCVHHKSQTYVLKDSTLIPSVMC